ncbi:MAG: hypothetical protein NTV52_01980, partial [Acidobacteria bacterium]|nr:hypothetical protein [Acidobacteriota bacterium]
MKKIAVEGGAAVTLCDAPVGEGAGWSEDGNSIIVALSNTGGLWRVSASGGTPEALTQLNPGEVSHRWHFAIPRSQLVLFTSAPQIGVGYDDATIEVVSLKTGERRTVQRGGFYPRYLADGSDPGGSGHMIYLHQATLFAVPFHPGGSTLPGAPVPILNDVSSTQAAGGDFAFARNGTFVYSEGNGSLPKWPISWVGPAGNSETLHAPPGQYYYPRFSPDGKRLAFSMNNGKGQDIWVKDLNQEAPLRLSFLPGASSHPVWTPDGKHIVFRSFNASAPGLYRIRSDGAGEAKRLTDGKVIPVPTSFSPDGKRLAIFQPGNGGNFDIFTVPVEAEPGSGEGGFRLGKDELFLGTPFLEVYPEFSPDGRWLAYASNESGTQELYVRPYPGPGGRWQVSTEGGRFPQWSKDGRELFFQG